MDKCDKIIKEIEKISNEKLAIHHQNFFKAQKGEYGEGDLFFGCNVPDLRKIAKNHLDCTLTSLNLLLKNPYHEVRLCGLFILVYKFKKNKNEQEKIVQIYLENIDFINNWDLVDSSASYILGDFYFKNKNYNILKNLSNKKHLWANRIAIVSTHYFIKNNFFDLTLEFAEKYLTHQHHLIHKATGWMLREIGKKDESILIAFLNKNSKIMPRIMLRYSIEKLSEKQKKNYMKK